MAEEPKKPNTEPTKDKKQIEIPDWGKSLTVLIISVALFLILFYFSPVP